MDLLPKSSEEFSSQQYWDLFFSKRKEDPFEWYGEYPELAEHLHKYIRPNDNLLIVGCGNSSLSCDLHTAGIKNQKSLDISSVVVNQMKTKYPHIDFIEGDVTSMTFPDLTFTCILDKGTFDALSPPPKTQKEKRNKTEFDDDEKDNVSDPVKVDLMMKEISRTLKPGGRFICISLLQPHVASRLLPYFHELGWMVRVVRCLDAERKTAEKSESVVFPVFMSIFTKLNLPQGIPPILEASSTFSATTLTRFTSLEELLAFIKEQQNFSLVQKKLNQLGSCAEEGLQLQLDDLKTGKSRYILNVVDVPKLMNNAAKQMFGVFIVPQGRESEWLFGTHEGQKTLATQANFTRLVTVHLVRGQVYSDMNAIQAEIRGPLSSLSPNCVKDKNIKAPIMTVGNDVGNRLIVFKGHSEFSGDFVVEDVSCEGKIFRRLIFLNSPNIIQSEVEVIVVNKRGKEFRNLQTTSKLSCLHHALMTMSFGFLRYFFKEEKEVAATNALLVGCGGGLLASFLINFIPHLALSVVEIDKEIVSVAKAHFGLPDKEQLKVIVDDGLKFIQSTESQYNIILIDVDNKSTEEGLSCPPRDFLEVKSLENFKSRMTSNVGAILVMNLVCRNEELKKSYVNLIQQQFPLVLICDVPSEVNTLLFCFNKRVDDSFNLRNITTHVKSSVELILDGSKSKTNKTNPKSAKKAQSGLDSVNFYAAFDDDFDSIVNNFKVLKV